MVCSNRFLLISLFLVAFTRWDATNRALMSANMMGCRTWEQDWLHAEPDFVSTLMDKLYGWQWNLSADNFHCKSHNHCKWIACSKCRNRRRKLREGDCVLHTLQIPCAMPGNRNENLPPTVPWMRGYREGKRGNEENGCHWLVALASSLVHVLSWALLLSLHRLHFRRRRHSFYALGQARTAAAMLRFKLLKLSP